MVSLNVILFWDVTLCPRVVAPDISKEPSNAVSHSIRLPPPPQGQQVHCCGNLTSDRTEMDWAEEGRNRNMLAIFM